MSRTVFKSVWQLFWLLPLVKYRTSCNSSKGFIKCRSWLIRDSSTLLINNIVVSCTACFPSMLSCYCYPLAHAFANLRRTPGFVFRYCKCAHRGGLCYCWSRVRQHCQSNNRGHSQLHQWRHGFIRYDGLRFIKQQCKAFMRNWRSIKHECASLVQLDW